AQFIYRFLTDPEPIIFQERLQIARTPLNETYEFRVDFLDCEPMNSFPRYTQEYLNDGAIAEMVLREFCKRAPQEFQYMSGGADVAKLSDGTWKIIEFNFGANSGGMDPYLYTIPYHNMISRLTGTTSEL